MTEARLLLKKKKKSTDTGLHHSELQSSEISPYMCLRIYVGTQGCINVNHLCVCVRERKSNPSIFTLNTHNGSIVSV